MMSRFSSLRGRVYLELLLPLLAAPWCAGCSAPTYAIGSEDDVTVSGGGTADAKESALLNSGTGGKVGSTGSVARSSNASGGGGYAITPEVGTEGGTYPANGSAFNMTTRTTENLGAQGGAESTAVTSLDWTHNVGGAEGNGGARTLVGNTGAQTSVTNGGAVTAGGFTGTVGALNAGGAKSTPLIASGGAESTGGTTSTGGAWTTGGTTNTRGVATGGTLGTGGTRAIGGTSSTGGVATGGVATGGTPSNGGTSSASAYCSTYTDLGARTSTGTEYREIPVAATCYRFTVAATNEVFRGLQMSNCDTRTVTINGISPGCSPSTNCSVSMYLPRASDGYFYVSFSAGSSTNCTSTWWWSP